MATTTYNDPVAYNAPLRYDGVYTPAVTATGGGRPSRRFVPYQESAATVLGVVDIATSVQLTGDFSDAVGQLVALDIL